MKISRRSLMKSAGCAAVAAGRQHPAHAQPYPVRPIRIVVGFPPGGPLDIAARTVAPFLSSRFGVDVAVDNLPGASGNTATAEVARAAPDGHTLLLCGPVNTINATLFEGLEVDFSRDIAPVAAIARVPLVVEVNPSVPTRTIAGLIDLARNQPGRVRVAFAGNGTPQHIAIVLFESMTGVSVAKLPYAGSAPALADLLRGEVDAMFDPLPSSMPHLRAGRLVPLATTGPTRAAALPDVPTLDATVPGYEAGSWFGLGAPRATPPDLVDTLNAAVNAALADPAVTARFDDLGATITPGSPTAFRRFIADETEKYRRLIRSAHIKPV